MPHAEKLPLKPWCIFIIDESPDDRDDIRRMLLKGSERRLTFVEAGSGARGVKAVLNAVAPPNCIVLHYNLPDMNAPEVLSALVGADGMPMCPVVVVTGGANREEGRLALRAGAQDYIAKDWTNSSTLSRTVENASESWTMARELRHSKGALRLVTDRETFRSVFGDATRGLTDEHALRRMASHLLGVHLQVNRVMYGEVVGEETVVIGQSYVSGVHQIDGTYRLEDYGPKLLSALLSGENVVVSDLIADGGYSESEKAAYAQMKIVANLSIPILKNGRLVALLGVHQDAPRAWTPEDIALAREIAERTWAAVEQVRSEAKLLASRIQLSQIVATMPSFSAVLRGPLHVIELANQALFDLVHQGPEILGKTFVEAFPELATQAFPQLLDTVYRTGEKFEATGMRAIVRSGLGGELAEIFVDFVYLPMREADGQVSGIFIHGVDRSAEVRASQELAQRARELRSVTENTPDGLTRFDHQFRYVFVNSVMEKLSGHSVAEILGKTHRQLGVPDKLCAQWEKAIRYVFDHAADSSVDFSLDTPHAGLRHFSCRLVPEFNEDGQVASALGVTHDITNRRAYEERLLEQDVRKDEFLATLAHELRNPLAPIRTGLQLLKLSPKEEVVARTLPVMERQLGQLVRLIDDLLDVSRINSGKIVLKRELVEFQEIAATALEASRPFIDVAGHSLTIDWPDVPVWLDADPTRLAQILSNLLTNSAKYMHLGGQINFSARLQDENILISVRDTGMGIPAEMLDSVFDMFTQVNRTLDRAQGGLGIGLSLVKMLVEMHGGAVQAASDGIDMGSEFTVSLPTASALALAFAPQAAAPAVPAALAGCRILVVDDNVDAAETMIMLLEIFGHDARSVFSGEAALDLAFSFLPDIVFLDIGLPGMNGYEVAKRLLANPLTASAKLIALTGWGTENDIRKSKAAGFNAHLTKPVNPDAVEAILLTLLSAQPLDKHHPDR